MSAPLNFSTLHPLRDEAEYEAAAAEIERLLEADPPRGSADYERLDFLTILVRAYDEDRHAFTAESVTPQTVVEFVMRQRGMERADLAPVLGGEGRAAAFFEGRRTLTVPEIIVLREQLKIPADVLLTPHAGAPGDDAAVIDLSALGDQLDDAYQVAGELAADLPADDERAGRLLDLLRDARATCARIGTEW